jgi:carboxymethylenebutenolidase
MAHHWAAVFGDPCGKPVARHAPLRIESGDISGGAMGERIEIDTANGSISAWRAMPDGKPRGGVVVIQEIFGVNAHIRSVTERFATYGYAAIAPALFDPAERDVELGYDAAGIARGRELVTAIGFDGALDSVDAAAKALRHVGKIAAIGYCWGGSVAFLANTRLGLPAVSYYGARTLPFTGEKAQAALLFHFGERDGSIPPADIAAIKAAQPQAEFHVWPAGHGFNCDMRADYDATSAANALAVTLGFLERELN